MMASPGNRSPEAVFFELQYGTNKLVATPGSQAPPNTSKNASFYGHMRVLPSGQILLIDFSKDIEIYTPYAGTFQASWDPVIKHINSFDVSTCSSLSFYPPPPCVKGLSPTTTYTLDGLQLNGLSQGAAYGDDYQSATNYPLVTITQMLPLCFATPWEAKLPGVIGLLLPDARPHFHGVATGNLLVTTNFECPNVP